MSLCCNIYASDYTTNGPGCQNQFIYHTPLTPWWWVGAQNGDCTKMLTVLGGLFLGDNIMSLETHCDPGPYDVKGTEILQRFWVPGENSCDLYLHLFGLHSSFFKFLEHIYPHLPTTSSHGAFFSPLSLFLKKAPTFHLRSPFSPAVHLMCLCTHVSECCWDMSWQVPRHSARRLSGTRLTHRIAPSVLT